MVSLAILQVIIVLKRRKVQKIHNAYAKYFLKEIYWQNKNNKQIRNQEF